MHMWSQLDYRKDDKNWTAHHHISTVIVHYTGSENVNLIEVYKKFKNNKKTPVETKRLEVHDRSDKGNKLRFSSSNYNEFNNS